MYALPWFPLSWSDYSSLGLSDAISVIWGNSDGRSVFISLLFSVTDTTCRLVVNHMHYYIWQPLGKQCGPSDREQSINRICVCVCVFVGKYLYLDGDKISLWGYEYLKVLTFCGHLKESKCLHWWLDLSVGIALIICIRNHVNWR